MSSSESSSSCVASTFLKSSDFSLSSRTAKVLYKGWLIRKEAFSLTTKASKIFAELRDDHCLHYFEDDSLEHELGCIKVPSQSTIVLFEANLIRSSPGFKVSCYLGGALSVCFSILCPTRSVHLGSAPSTTGSTASLLTLVMSGYRKFIDR